MSSISDALFRQALVYARESRAAPTAELRDVLTCLALRYAMSAGSREGKKGAPRTCCSHLQYAALKGLTTGDRSAWASLACLLRYLSGRCQFRLRREITAPSRAHKLRRRPAGRHRRAIPKNALEELRRIQIKTVPEWL